MAAKAATRGTLIRKQAIRVAGGSSARFLTLPPGCVRKYPFRDHVVFDGCSSENDDEIDNDSRPRMQKAMRPGVRSFGTTSLDTPEYFCTQSCEVRHIPTETPSFEEDYDEWSLHVPPSSATTLSDYEPGIESILHTSTLNVNNTVEYSSPFETAIADDDYLELDGWRFDEADDVSLEH